MPNILYLSFTSFMVIDHGSRRVVLGNSLECKFPSSILENQRMLPVTRLGRALAPVQSPEKGGPSESADPVSWISFFIKNSEPLHPRQRFSTVSQSDGRNRQWLTIHPTQQTHFLLKLTWNTHQDSIFCATNNILITVKYRTNAGCALRPRGI